MRRFRALSLAPALLVLSAIEQALEMRARLVAALVTPHELRVCANCTHGAIGPVNRDDPVSVHVPFAFHLGAFAWHYTDEFLASVL